MMIQVKEGQYYYAPHRRKFGVWKKGKTVNGSSMDDFVSDFSTKIQAQIFVNKMNNLKKEEESEDADI